MKKKSMSRLTLNRETLRFLQQPELQRAAGLNSGPQSLCYTCGPACTNTRGCSCATQCSAGSCPAATC